jgi:succinate dehydrogenase / fumarate reductase flavoprotein subunit
VDYFHKTLGKILYDYCGLARNEKGLRYAIVEINRLKQEFYKDVIVSGEANTLNTELEKAGRVADYFEIGELMCYDALTRNESCGAHFREEYQTADGEALRNDAEYQFISAWAWKGEGQEPELIREPLIFEEIQPTVRSYK